MVYSNQNNSLMQQIFGSAPSTSTSTHRLNEQSLNQLQSVVSTIDKAGWQKLVAQAKSRGIPEDQIKQGLEFLLQRR